MVWLCFTLFWVVFNFASVFLHVFFILLVSFVLFYEVIQMLAVLFHRCSSTAGAPEAHHGNSRTPATHLPDVKDSALLDAGSKGHHERKPGRNKTRTNPEVRQQQKNKEKNNSQSMVN